MIRDRRTTPRLQFNKIPKLTCDAYTNIHGQQLKGFTCPIKNSVQYFCCGTDTHRYCCSPDRYSFEHSFIFYSTEVYNQIVANNDDLSLYRNQKIINKQFEQFQRYFLPIFLLTTTILLLVGIACWFWLYKHKTFHSLGEDECLPTRKSSQENLNLTFERRSHFSTTAV